MTKYNRCLQIVFILVQLVFMVLGVTMIGVGAWLEVQEQSITAAIENSSFLAGPYLIIAVGCAILVVAVVGIVGALCDKKINRFLLIVYIVLVLLVFVAQLVGGILGFVYRDQLTTFIGSGLSSTQNRYGIDSTPTEIAITESWDYVQRTLECCGIESPEDWTLSNGTFGNNAFPASCCMPALPDCNNITSINGTAVSGVYTMGCTNQVISFIQDQLLIVAAVAIAFVVGEIIVVLMAFCLVCCTDFEE